jgi:hypothetical protein
MDDTFLDEQHERRSGNYSGQGPRLRVAKVEQSPNLAGRCRDTHTEAMNPDRLGQAEPKCNGCGSVRDVPFKGLCSYCQTTFFGRLI